MKLKISVILFIHWCYPHVFALW